MDLILTKLTKSCNFPQLGNYDLKIDAHNVTRCFLTSQLHVSSSLHTIYSLYFIVINFNGQLLITNVCCIILDRNHSLYS